MRKVRYLFLSDTHAPWHDHKALKSVQKFAKETKPEQIIHLGDLMDLYLLSSFYKTELAAMTPTTVRRELGAAVGILKMFAPYSKKPMLWLKGNHEARLEKRLAEVPFLSGYVRSPFDRIARDVKNVKFIHRGSIMLPNKGGAPIFTTHGWRSRMVAGTAAASLVRDRSVIQGHTHGAGVIWVTPRLFAMECGHLSRQTAPCFHYMHGADLGLSRWRTAFSTVTDDGAPHLEVP